jgi:transketolase C-terminal domain/subunit
LRGRTAVAKPLDTESVLTAAPGTGALFTLEEHSIIGGLGGAVADVLAENEDFHFLFRRIGQPLVFLPHRETGMHVGSNTGWTRSPS